MRPLPIAQSLLWTALAACPLGAVEVPHLLADINTTPSAQLPVSQAFGFIAVGGRLLFSTDGQDNGNDDEGILWQTDGTATGTRVLSSSLCPFPCRGISPLGTVLHGIALLKVSLGSFSTQKTQLWRSDGTATGTFPLTDLLDNEGAFDLTPLQIISSSSGDVFYFNGCRESDGCLLWRSDGSRAGTFPLPSTGDPRGFAFWAGRLYFLADVENGFGLWSTDGTVAGTAPLASVAELDEFSGTIVATPSHLFFTAGDGSEDLWVTDGTPDGARLLADLPPNPCFPGSGGCVQGDVFSLFAFGDAVFFVAHRPGHGTEIWHSDGTVSGTGPGVELPAGLDVDDRQRLGSRWLLRVVPRGTSSGGALWTADDDFSHAEPLTGCDGGACPDAVQLFSLATGGSLLFAGSDAPHGTELWITDGTGGGTHRLSDACPGACSAFSPDFSFLAGAVLGSAAELTYFRALPSA
ncbi:MAG TPA: hypothetical protein VLX28_26355, partial [Thermoanaerobaculia bacterium]|nr:hypothetical protein [Thermoanaerobaculia bacterium]